MPEPSSRMLHQYRLVQEIGAGGMGSVWKAVDTTLDREVAIKFLPENLAATSAAANRFQREAKIVASLNHPNIVTIYSVEAEAGRPFITMELVHGQPLSRLIPSHGLPLQRFFRLALPLVEAVAAAHEKGVLHRDLKPDNIMVGADERVKVLDFGVAKLLPQTGSGEETVLATRTVTRQGDIVGTVPYMSPEQVQGGQVDVRSDIFSLGVILYQMLAGRRPFAGKSLAELAASILRDTPDDLARAREGLPGPLVDLARRCLEKEVERRYQTAADLRQDLAAAKAAAAVSSAPAVPSVAVLPFADMSPNKDQDYFCEGMADEIINALAKIRGLRVTPRRTAFRFKDSVGDVRDIGRQLGVTAVLEGGVRKAAERLRITVELIDVEDNAHRWSQKYDRDLGDVFAVQEEIATEIVAALQVTLSPRESLAIRPSPTADLQAYDYYLRGRNYLYRWGRRNIEYAAQMFAKAIEIDPRYALAHAGLADCHTVLYAEFGKDPAHLEKAKAASGKAVELQPALAEGHSARGIALAWGRHYAAAEEEFQRAIELDPMLFEAHYFYARACFAQGKIEKAALQYEEAARVRPTDYQALKLLSTVYTGLGRAADSQEASRRASDIIEKHLEIHPDDVRARYFGAGALVELGARERGLEWARLALAMDPDDPETLYNIACVYSLAGSIDEAIDTLEKTVEAGTAKSKEWVQQDSDLDRLRTDPRFQALLARLK